jgi:hypothetical protein
MNSNAGAPHILLFERDQQLVGLLASELQLAGFECHTARTAVEVFDAIARYPIRMVLVNLAQAATARREFWVALDTQRRGRGIQVFTFHCTNLAGYGPASDDDEDRSHTATADMEVDGMMGVMGMINAICSRIAAAQNGVMPRASAPPAPQVTAPVPSVPASGNAQVIRGTVPTNPPPPADMPRPASTHYTDKIRAVIYPNQRSWNAPAAPAAPAARDGGQYTPLREQQIAETPWPAPSQVDTGGSGPSRRPLSDAGLPKESSLAQLSRMLQEHRSADLDEFPTRRGAGTPELADPLQEDTSVQQRVRPGHEMPISSIPLRASPIQDMPIERTGASQAESVAQVQLNPRRHEEPAAPHFAQAPSALPLASLGMSAAPPQPPPAALPFQAEGEKYTPANASVEAPAASTSSPQTHQPGQAEQSHNEPAVEEDNRSFEQAFGSQLAQAGFPTPPRAPDNALLLDIMQSLPPMSSPPPQPQALSGRATRSLGSVLLEGHLVPQSRLEVAQSIQRMLSGVDMNYQLGEILLMFKLLTPDQLLAASLVSYGLITTIQISALGRIRQELHSIGLEYDLESLVILFRILTSDQLREVRTAWSG